jgi:hypothetical protein
MQQLDTYQRYLNLHQDFNQEHKIISKRITDMYQLPKRFMEQNEKAIQKCFSEKAQDGVPHHAELSPSSVRDFLFVVEDFKLQTMELFFEHRVHIDKCTSYIMKVSELQAKYEGEEEFVKLVPQLDDLRTGLKDLLTKAEVMVVNLDQIEKRWERISSK